MGVRNKGKKVILGRANSKSFDPKKVAYTPYGIPGFFSPMRIINHLKTCKLVGILIDNWSIKAFFKN